MVKTRGAKFPTIGDIKNCCLRNPDGFAMAWNERGTLLTYRTMSREAFLKKYQSVVSSCDANTTAMVLHARIATHGSKGTKNCHCWKGGGFAFAHNGMLDVKNRDDMTDSETFFRDIFLPIYTYGGWKKAERAVHAVIGSSKFAFIDKAGNVKMFGAYLSHDECFYSNNSWTGPVCWSRPVRVNTDARINWRDRYGHDWDELFRGDKCSI